MTADRAKATLIIQIFCYNNEESLAGTIAALPRVIEGIGVVEILVVNDGSTDRTVEVARSSGVHHILDIPANRGLAHAFCAGSIEAARLGADYLVNLDADDQYSTDDIRKLLKPLIHGQADMTVGERPIIEMGPFGILRRNLQRLESWLARRLGGHEIKDASSTFRAMNLNAMIRLHVFNQYTYTHESLIAARELDLKVIGVPIRVNADKQLPSRLPGSAFNYAKRSGAIGLRTCLIYNSYKPLIWVSALFMGTAVLLAGRSLYHYASGGGTGDVHSTVIVSMLLTLGLVSFMVAIASDIMMLNRRLTQKLLEAFRLSSLAESRSSKSPPPQRSGNEVSGAMAPKKAYAMLQPTPHFLSTKERIFAGLSVIIAMLSGYAMYKAGGVITGPFIFGDELDYFSYAYDLFMGADISRRTQYGVLYPALASFFFNLGDLESVYRSLRLFNIAAFVSSAVPAFLLARLLLPNSAMLLLLPAFVVTVPFSGFVNIIWADPLYYTLFLWTVFALLQFYRQPGVAMGSACGILLALLFHTKPGAGLVVQLSAFVSLAALIGTAPSQERKRLVVPIAVLVLCCLIPTFPWMARNLSLGVGIFGYSIVTSSLASRIAEFGYSQFLREATLSVFYQLAYVFIGTWGLLGVLIALPIMRWRTLPKELSTLIVFALACVAGLIALLTIGLTAMSDAILGYWAPGGRYLSIIFPLIISLAICLLARGAIRAKSEIFWQALVITTLTGIAILATPLFMATPLSFVNNTELALPIWIIDKGKIVWRGIYDPSALERIVLAMTVGLTSLLLFLVSKKRKILLFCVILVLVSSIVVTLAEHSYIRIMGHTQSGMNDVIRFLNRQNALGESSAFDRRLGTNVEFISKFWTINHRPGSVKVRYLDTNDIVQRDGNAAASRFFVSSEKLPLPLVFSSNGIFVYQPIPHKVKTGAE